MRELPRGTVTLLFTEIEGSTRLVYELGDAYVGVLAGHRRVLRDAFARHHGVEMGTEGDAFFVVFADAGDAVAAACDAQSELAADPAEFEAAWAAGRALSLEQAVEEALRA